MKEFFKEVIRINMMEDALDKETSAREMFKRLNSMETPEYFNWVGEIFEDLHVRQNPDKKALLWTDMDTLETRTYTYRELLQKANQLINFLSGSGVKKGDNLYMMSPVLPENWFACLACIKAGIVMVPTATTMTQRELEFRFETYPPAVILADENGACLINRALEQTQSEPRVKIVLGKKEGWTSFEETENESTEAEAAKTKSGEILFCFFTSGTTGLPKRVGHTAVSYPLGHLSTTVMIGVQPDDIHHNLGAPGWAKWTWSSFFCSF